jgi:hypothetical protein
VKRLRDGCYWPKPERRFTPRRKDRQHAHPQTEHLITGASSGLTEGIRAELMRTPIKVATIYPGNVDTELTGRVQKTCLLVLSECRAADGRPRWHPWPKGRARVELRLWSVEV